jgi:hypothetical protein
VELSPAAFVIDAASVTLGLLNGATLVALPTLPAAYKGTLALPDPTAAISLGGTYVDVNLSQTLLDPADMADFIGPGNLLFSLFDSPGVNA